MNQTKKKKELNLGICACPFSVHVCHAHKARLYCTGSGCVVWQSRQHQACLASLNTYRHTPSTCRQSRLTDTCAHTHAHRRVCVWCDAGRCGDQWESMLGPLTEAIKREWIMRLFIDWCICNQGILLWRSWGLFSFSLPSFCPLPFPSCRSISLLQGSEPICFRVFS